MGKVGIIAGSVFHDMSIFSNPNEKIFETFCGNVHAQISNDVIYIPRHEIDKTTPPHKINHHANITALYNSGVQNLVAVNSCASLDLNLKPGSIIIPDDYVNLGEIKTFYNNVIEHATPCIDDEMRRLVIHTAKNMEIPVITKGIYVQVHGPRYPTRAEIRFFKRLGDVVGMTMAHEATLAKERDIKYVSICAVDNYCNGIIEKEMQFKKIAEISQKTSQKIKELVLTVINKI